MSTSGSSGPAERDAVRESERAVVSGAEPLRVLAFPGAPNLPILAGIERGDFRRRGLDVELELTSSSVDQARRCAAGEVDVICTAFDNVLAYGRSRPTSNPEVLDPGYVVVMGATQLELSLVVSRNITEVAQLRGRRLALDATGTGFAFVLLEMLADAGVGPAECDLVSIGATPQRWRAVQEGTCAATLTIEPFTSLAVGAGFPVLARSSDLFDDYQGGVVATRRPLLLERPDAIMGFIHGYLDGLAWARDPNNRSAVADLLAKSMDLPPERVDAVVDATLSPRTGLTPDGRLLERGMAVVSRLRSRYADGDWGNPEDYLDLRLYEQVMAER